MNVCLSTSKLESLVVKQCQLLVSTYRMKIHRLTSIVKLQSFVFVGSMFATQYVVERFHVMSTSAYNSISCFY